MSPVPGEPIDLLIQPHAGFWLPKICGHSRVKPDIVARSPDMNPDCGALLTDLYELTMLQGYWQHEMYETAVFEFFVRKLPKHRNFLVAAGLEQAIGYLEGLAFSPTEIEWLEQTRRFHPNS